MRSNLLMDAEIYMSLSIYILLLRVVVVVTQFLVV